MLQFLMDHKWIILAITETLSWIFFFIAICARYLTNSKFLFVFTGIVSLVTGFVPQISLGILNLYRSGEVDFFLIFIVALLIYSFTFGKKHMKILDDKLGRFFLNMKKLEKEEE